MCGRFLFTYDDDIDEIRELTDKIIKKYGSEPEFKTGEIFPTNIVPIMIGENHVIAPDIITWGFPNFKNKGVIINARAETAMEKFMFRESVMFRRCVIPSTGFFEWNQKGEKHKYLCKLNQKKMLYMAGCYQEFKGERRFVILTTEANESMKDIHHRMPVILDQNSVEPWIFDNSCVRDVLFGTQPEIIKEVV